MFKPISIFKWNKYKISIIATIISMSNFLTTILFILNIL